MFEPQNLVLWLPALGLAVLLRLITHKYHHQLIFPLCESDFLPHPQGGIAIKLTLGLRHQDFIVIPMIFYIVVAAAQLDLGVLQQAGWLFDMGNSADRSWYEFYTYYGGCDIFYSEAP